MKRMVLNQSHEEFEQKSIQSDQLVNAQRADEENQKKKRMIGSTFLLYGLDVYCG